MSLSLREALVIVPRHDLESKEIMIVHTRVVRYPNVQVHERHWCSWGYFIGVLGVFQWCSWGISLGLLEYFSGVLWVIELAWKEAKKSISMPMRDLRLAPPSPTFSRQY